MTDRASLKFMVVPNQVRTVRGVCDVCGDGVAVIAMRPCSHESCGDCLDTSLQRHLLRVSLHPYLNHEKLNEVRFEVLVYRSQDHQMPGVHGPFAWSL